MTTHYPAPWAWTPSDELTDTDDSLAQSCASPVTPHASPRGEVNPPVVVSSLDSPTGDFAPGPSLLEDLLDFSHQFQAKPAQATSQKDKPSLGGPIYEGASFGGEDTAIRDAPSLLFPELAESLDKFHSCDLPFNGCYSPDLGYPDFEWDDPMDVLPGPADDSDLPWEFLELDGQGPPRTSASIATTDSKAQSPWMQQPASQLQAAIHTASSNSSPELPPRSQDQQEEAQPRAEADRSNLASDVSNTDFSIESFSSFMAPVKPCSRASDSHISFLAAAAENQQSSSKPKKHVSWAPLPHEVDYDLDSPAPTSSFSCASPGIISHRAAGPPPGILTRLACISMRTSGIGLYRSYSQQLSRFHEQRPSTPPEHDDDVIFVKSVSKKRPYDLSAGASDDSYPAKRPRSPAKHPRPARVPVLLTQVSRQFYDGERVYKFTRATGYWQDRDDDTLLPDVRFDNVGDLTTLTLKVHPYGLNGEPVFLSWDKGEGMFCGYDIGRAYRAVGKHDVEKLMENPCQSLEIDWPELDDSC